MSRRLVVVAAVLLLAACGRRTGPASEPLPAADVPSEPWFDGLGTTHWPITTRSAQAQRSFDQGLAFLYGFNHDEAERQFARALALDPSCAMCAWGVAMAQGPHINRTAVASDRVRRAVEAIGRARSLAAGATPKEAALIEALARRHAWPAPEDRSALDAAFADAMEAVWRAYPDDPHVGALAAEARMNLRPWDLWSPDGRPRPGTEAIVATLDRVLALDPDHLLGNHLMIHAVEAGPQPERGLAAAEALRRQDLSIGHLVHMPSHLDVRLGRWQRAIEANRAAVDADRRYQELRPQQDFYRMYMAHNPHMLAFAAMMSGQGEVAEAAIRQMAAGIPEDWARENPDVADGFLGMPYEVLIRFGRWDEILAEPEPAAWFPTARALWRQARGIARAAKGEPKQARVEQAAFRELLRDVPEDRTFGNNRAADLLSVADRMLEGEILIREGRLDEGIAALREAVALEDRLRYDEPPDWMLPVRHPLGAALLRAGRPEEAEAVYREDLTRLPDNVWSLVGLARALRAQGRDAEAVAVDERLLVAAERADVALTSSCACLPGP